MAKYHVNPETGVVGVCRAKPGNCFYGSDSPHYDSEADGLKAYEESMRSNNPLESFKKQKVEMSKSIKDNISVSMDILPSDELLNYINSSPKIHKEVNEIIDVRAKNTFDFYNRLQNFKPSESSSGVSSDSETYRMLSNHLREYRDRSAEIVEAYISSDFYKPLSKKLDDDRYIGIAKKIDSLEPNTVEWVQARHNRIGASDVSSIATIDFTPPNELPSYAKLALSKVEKSKTIVEEPKNIHKVNSMKSGPLYIGRVWEDRIRDDFIKENPQYTVYNAKAQYQHPKNEWQVINLDGVMSDRPDGKPNCLLEIKTGSYPEAWEKGVPVGYRAQVLYALETTDLDYAIVEARINDNQRFTYRIEKGEEISPGHGISMKQYLENRITPWFEDLKSKRPLINT